MKKKKKLKKAEEGMVSEPLVSYNAASAKKIIFFNSFEEAEEHKLKEMASHTPEQRLINLEILRKQIYADKLLPDGTWPPLARKITFIIPKRK